MRGGWGDAALRGSGDLGADSGKRDEPKQSLRSLQFYLPLPFFFSSCPAALQGTRARTRKLMQRKAAARTEYGAGKAECNMKGMADRD